MKVLQILNELNFSGAEIMLCTAEKLFKKEGIDMHILTIGNEVGIYAQHLQELEIKITHIPFRRNLTFFVRLKKFLVNNKFDIVHIHPEQAFFWITLTCWNPFGRPKLIRTIHSTFRFHGYLKMRRTLHHFICIKFLKVKFIAISDHILRNEKELYKTTSLVINNWID